jgi:arabinose-5-phosphate isomerase
MSNSLNDEKLISIAIKTIQFESESIENLINLINVDFANAVRAIYNSNGRVVVTGIGKSANIATKIVATFNSTGTPAIFLHAADAIHGDLGMIQKNDTVICISKSGNTPEIKVLLSLIKSFGNKIIAITGNPASYLAVESDFTLNSYVEKEACPHNLAPTTSTTAQLVLGDALAIALLELKGFTSEDFAKFHPGGSLGKKLYLRVSDLLERNQKPVVMPKATVKQVIVEISSKRLGTTAVVDGEKLIGIITDGDLRRMLEKNANIDQLLAEDIMSVNPRTIASDAMAVEALQMMETFNITQLLVTDEGVYKGVIHLHDLLKEGIL